LLHFSIKRKQREKAQVFAQNPKKKKFQMSFLTDENKKIFLSLKKKLAEKYRQAFVEQLDRNRDIAFAQTNVIRTQLLNENNTRQTTTRPETNSKSKGNRKQQHDITRSSRLGHHLQSGATADSTKNLHSAHLFKKKSFTNEDLDNNNNNNNNSKPGAKRSSSKPKKTHPHKHQQKPTHDAEFGQTFEDVDDDDSEIGRGKKNRKHSDSERRRS
jgi:hypothetical protein